jgi:Secretion system C-terminal sorting domain
MSGNFFLPTVDKIAIFLIFSWERMVNFGCDKLHAYLNYSCMKLKSLLFCITIISFQHAICQSSWFEEGNTWVYTWGLPGIGGYEELKVDTGNFTIDGKTCKTLLKSRSFVYYNWDTMSYQYGTVQNSPITVCESGDSIFYLNYQGQMELMYDMSMMPGDSMFLLDEFGGECNYKLVLDSIGTTIIQNQNLKTQYFTPINEQGSGPNGIPIERVKIIEKIGMVEAVNGFTIFGYLVPDMLLNCWFDGDYWSLRCYANNEIDYKLVGDCYGLPVATSEPNDQNESIDVYPNPIEGAFYIVNKSGEKLNKAGIYAVNGDLLWTTNDMSQTINVGDIPAGFYILVVESDKMVFRKKLLIK